MPKVKTNAHNEALAGLALVKSAIYICKMTEKIGRLSKEQLEWFVERFERIAERFQNIIKGA